MRNVRMLCVDGNGTATRQEVPEEGLGASIRQMQAARQERDPDMYGILSAKPEDIDIDQAVEAACEILVCLEEDKETMSSQRKQNLELNRRVLVEKMRSIPAAAEELSEELEDCKDGPYLEACSKLPQLIIQLQADLAARA